MKTYIVSTRTGEKGYKTNSLANAHNEEERQIIEKTLPESWDIISSVAVMAKTKAQAYEKVAKAYPNRKVYKSNVKIAGCHYDYCTGDKA